MYKVMKKFDIQLTYYFGGFTPENLNRTVIN